MRYSFVMSPHHELPATGELVMVEKPQQVLEHMRTLKRYLDGGGRNSDKEQAED